MFEAINPIYRDIAPALGELIGEFPAVTLLGPRQVGKTTLARQWVKHINQSQKNKAVYLDLELAKDRQQIEDLEGFLAAHHNRLVVLDEVQRIPELFATLRGVIDERIMGGERTGQFLLLGSASGALLKQTSESLAGRVVTLELRPFQEREFWLSNVEPTNPLAQQNHLWIRGGFPMSYLAKNAKNSQQWREAFITSYLERDIPALGVRIPATTLRRLWTMLAHNQGQMLNQSQLASALSIAGQTVTRYIDVLCDLMLVRRLPPWSNNLGKRLVRTPKVYVRDSGLLHSLLELHSLEAVLSHPIAGQSWEGYVIEQLIAVAPRNCVYFYRTSHGAECDVLIDWPRGETWVFEIKRSSAPTVSRGFHEAAKDLKATRKILVAPVDMCYPMKEGIEVMPLLEAVRAVEKRAA
jgi:uncharacterized protein